MTIMDWLENAEYNIGSPYPNSTLMASEQLRNAIFLLAQGYSVDTNVDQLISRYGSIDSIPPRDEADMTTISDWLDDAQRNFYSQDSTSKLFALKQYIFANNLLGKGYSLDTNVDELLTMYGSVDSIPPRKELDITTISDWLRDAELGFSSPLLSSRLAGMTHYIFANNLLGKGYALDTNVDELLTMYGSVDSIPPRKEHEAQC